MKAEILSLFERLADREEEIKELREENKDAIDTFCNQHEGFEPKAIKEAYKLFKSLSKDKSAATDFEYQRDKLVEILIREES